MPVIAMMEYPLRLYRGDTYSRGFRLWADVAQTVPVDLTGVTVTAEIRNRPGGSQVVVIPVSVATNVITIAITATLAQLVPMAGVWDLQLAYAGGEVRTIVHGAVTVSADVTGSQPVAS